ncbi:cellulose binding domain-containing protein [Paenibacillus sp. PCH8]|uniref:cellulose binding domain-containing protein n=1 Tax=Paenibacillus sp. PCH8 TaxID=2066524 RepID=UPI00280B1F36|nr:cellulose binding domain-containing protein [Paenibacillus sp. PCH8]
MNWSASPGSTSYIVQRATPQAGTTTPTSNLILQYRAADTDATNNHIKPYFNIKNNGTSAVNLSGLKIRYYFTKDGSEGLNTIIDWAQIGAANITTSLGSVTGTNADTYVEIGFTSGAGSLLAGGQTGDIPAAYSQG